MKSIAKFLGIRKRGSSFVVETTKSHSDTDKWNHTNMNGMKKLIKYLDVRLNESSPPEDTGDTQLSHNLFDDTEVTEDVLNIMELVENDHLNDTYLQSIPSLSYLTMAFKRLIITHEPVVPYSYYDHFLSPVANYEKLIQQINKSGHYFLDYIMNFLARLVLNPDLLVPVKYIGKTVGIYLIRAENISLYKRNDVDDINHRQEVFAKLVDKYCQEARLNQSYAAAMEEKPSTPPPLAPIQERSIKVTFTNPENRPSQEYLQSFFSQFGTVVNV